MSSSQCFSSEKPNMLFYYVNGVANTEEDAKQTTQRIGEIIKEGIGEGEEKPICLDAHYNDSTPTERIATNVLLICLGFSCVAYWMNQESKKKWNTCNMIVGAAGVCAICALFIDQFKIQDYKNKISGELTEEIKYFLNKNPLNIANLILHSQGADIGARSLSYLEEYKDRIRVITLGGMVTIRQDIGYKVKNFMFENDPIQIQKLDFDEILKLTCTKDSKDLIILKKDRFTCGVIHGLADIVINPLTHGVMDYLAHTDVKQSICCLLNED